MSHNNDVMSIEYFESHKEEIQKDLDEIQLIMKQALDKFKAKHKYVPSCTNAFPVTNL